MKHKKEVAPLTSAERGNLITVVTCMNATGINVPPLIMFPCKSMKEELLDGAPSGSILACHPSGWIQTDVFIKQFNHFVYFVKPACSSNMTGSLMFPMDQTPLSQLQLCFHLLPEFLDCSVLEDGKNKFPQTIRYQLPTYTA